ncbi:hypothetical protein PILCRDRAFT_611893 [Piloderma croceum F 1598]|uniref:Zn(2)-C6 fungal-type domain-containing protein n=1 Tax=Piloderma croceum (strain F 1598) TaxID=765440 RepID=A0A0C3FDL6_PILCF|nr:hypothetical protein PILCRDRAFT_611893 [Piloderma croceum F 1598]
MPQVSNASESSSTHDSGRSSGTGSRNASNPKVLKRFQACHQCRKRKLKCDAKRPCSTCVRSYAHAVAHTPKGAEVPPKLECTFDTVLEVNPVGADVPKNRYDTLESRIDELETLLYHNRRSNDYDSSPPPQFDSWSQSLDRQSNNLQGSSTSLSHTPPDINGQVDSASFTGFPHSKQNLTATATALATSSTSDVEATFFDHQFVPTFDLTGVGSSVNEDNFSFISQLEYPTREEVPVLSDPSPELEMIWSNWPPNLPPPDLLRHLVEVFFAFQHHARRLFHAPSFMASLSLPPSDPGFPIAPVLHAICSVSPMYTAVVSSPPLPNFARQAPDEIFQQRHRVNERRPESFAEEQARRARETIDVYVSRGEQPIQVMQANVILSWYFWCHAK